MRFPSASSSIVALAAIALVACGTRERAASDAASTAAPAADSARRAAPPPPSDVRPSIPRDLDTLTMEPAPDTISEPRALAGARGVSRRDSLTLVLALDDGRAITFADDLTDASWQRHAYLGRAAGAPFHVVRRSQVEHRDYLLVSARTGRRTALDAMPTLSPDGTRLVTTSMDLTAEFEPTRIEIWRIAGDSAVREWREEPSDWGPSDARWLDARTVAFTINRQVGPEPNVVARSAARVELRGGEWGLVR